MPIIDISSEHVAQQFAQFERLKLEKQETARICILEPSPVFEWTHTLRKPKVVGGEIVTEMVPKNDGSQDQRVKYDFISRVICKGRQDVMKEAGFDPDHCPVCAAYHEFPSWFEAPSRRFALNVFQYDTTSTGEMKGRFHGTMKVWAFTDNVYGKLVKIAKEGVDLRQIDLILGPCSVALYQQFDIMPSTKAEWTQNADTKRTTKEILQSKYSADVLSSACGRDKPSQFLLMDINEVKNTWDSVRNVAEADEPAPEMDVVQMNEVSPALQDLLGDAVSDPEPAAVPVVAEDPTPVVPEPGAAQAPEPPKTKAVIEPVPEPATAETPKVQDSAPAVDLESLFADMGIQ